MTSLELHILMTDDTSAAKSIVADAIRISSLLERAAFLERACGNDRELYQRVNSILESVDETLDVERLPQHRTEPELEATHVIGVHAASNSGDESNLSGTATTFPMVPGFEIIELLGRGGMGVVYKARQLNLKRLVALKMIRGEDLQDHDLSRFRAEAEAVARLQHPNIVQIYEVGEHHGRPYLALEFVDGGTLTDRIREQRISQRESAEIVEALAHAMHYAHQQGVVHRDLKPGNVLVAGQPAARSSSSKSSELSAASQSKSSVVQVTGRLSSGAIPKVMDFGLAKQLDGDSELTRTGAVLGTPSYMAPEQAAGRHDVGTPADVYSLGAILYALLTHRPPFRGDTAIETVMKVRDEDPLRPRKIDSRIDKDLEKICLKCLEKDPAQRYGDAQQLADDLRRYLNGDPVQAIAPSLAYRLKKFCHRHRSTVIAATIAAIALIAGGIAGITYLIDARERDREVEILAAAKLLAELSAERHELPQIEYRGRRAAMQRWLDLAEQLVAKLDAHRSTVRELRRAGEQVSETPLVEGGQAGDDGVAQEASSWRFDNPTIGRRHDHLWQLVRDLEAFSAPHGGRATVEDWIARTPSSEQFDEAWTAVIASVESKLGFKPAVQEGLYPIGRDKHSDLWEFVDLNTGQAIVRDPQGRLVVQEDSGIVFVLVPGGRFEMGSPEDEPDRNSSERQHPVFVSPFLISKYELIQAQWDRIMSQNPSETIRPTNPVDSVSWVDCIEFCEKTGSRLPTEAQWEYACRGGTSGPYSSDRPLGEIAWYSENCDSAHRVGEKLPNPFGLFDIHGNLLEWCQDAFAEDFYQQLEATGRDPVNLEGSGARDMHRVLRGGSFEGQADYLRSANRYHEKQNMRWRGFGLRPTRTVD